MKFLDMEQDIPFTMLQYNGQEMVTAMKDF